MSEILRMEFTTYIYLEYKRNNKEILRKQCYGKTTIITVVLKNKAMLCVFMLLPSILGCSNFNLLQVPDFIQTWLYSMRGMHFIWLPNFEMLMTLYVRKYSNYKAF